jgi:hypothetical protein
LTSWGFIHFYSLASLMIWIYDQYIYILYILYIYSHIHSIYI